MSNLAFKFGWKRDIPDHRDFKYALHQESESTVELPKKVSVEEGMPAVKNQLQMGSCVWNSIAAALEFLQLKAIKNGLNYPEIFNQSYTPISRLFGYYNSRAYDGDIPMDNGTQIRTGIKVCRNFGVCEETLWSYEYRNLYVYPSLKSYQEALHHRILTGYRLDHTRVESLKTCLANGYPFVFGVPVCESFMHVGPDGVVPLPTQSDAIVGGHCMVGIGYDSDARFFKVRNSWGEAFGDHGNCYMSFEYISTLAADIWTIRNE